MISKGELRQKLGGVGPDSRVSGRRFGPGPRKELTATRPQQHCDAMKKDADTPSLAARSLIRACDRAVLSTAHAEDGWPYGSLVMAACDHRARPLLLISDLAEHTKNLAADRRGSLLFDGTMGLDNPLTGARVTVLGRFAPTRDEALVRRYVARHPDAEMYLGFADFHLYEMTVERAHIVAGFGAIHWIPAEKLLFDAAAPLAEAEADIVAHMNDDHAEAVGLYATRLLGLPEGDWAMTGIDPEGLDLRDGPLTGRIRFPAPVSDPQSAREALVALARKARAV
jgi:putative heme iron utilization protein